MYLVWNTFFLIKNVIEHLILSALTTNNRVLLVFVLAIISRVRSKISVDVVF